MRKLVTTAASTVTIAAAVVVGAAFATDAADKTAAAPLKNISYVYNVDDSGGAGVEFYSISPPPTGVYQVSFSANFAGDGSAAQELSCLIIKNGNKNIAQSTTVDEPGNWYTGLNGVATIIVNPGDDLDVACGTLDDSSWTYGDRPLQVSLIRLDAARYDNLGTVSLPLHSTIGARGSGS
jgi:hypothetical protein